MAYGYSVVIPTSLDNTQYLSACLQTLREFSGGTVELIVVLNGKDQDASREIALRQDAKIVEVETRIGYSAACNLGIAMATGANVIISNDDVLFTPDWNVLLQECMTKYQDSYPECPPAAIVGPCSNVVAGIQQVQEAESINPGNFLDAAKVIASQPEQNWIAATFISGFCMMLSRSFIEEMDGKPFDERLVNGAEDNFACQQAMFRGYAVVACGNVFVYHHGSITTDRLPDDENNARGMRNLFDFYDYGNELITELRGDRPNEVAACCRVRLLTDDHLRVFLLALEKNFELADAMILLDDRSDKRLWKSALEYAGELAEEFNVALSTKSNPARAELNECRDRQWLLDQAREAVGDYGWFLTFDSDEVFEDKFDRAYIERLMNPPHPMILGYSFCFYTFWDEAETMWRSDGTFGQMAGHRMVRILPGYEMLVTDSGMHMGNVPMVRVSAVGADTSVRIKHYGFSTEEERRRKYDFYTEYDTVKDKAQIGHKDYRHLIASSVRLVQWVEETSLTIGTCVLNEEIALHNWLRNFWAFADKMIVTDTGSTDRTRELLEMWGVEVIEYNKATGVEWDPTFAGPGADLARARNLSMGAADTYWYWQIDPDEHARATEDIPHPLGYIRRLLDRTDLDAVQFFFRCIQPDGYHTLSQTPRLVSNPQNKAYFGYVHETLDRDLPESARVDYSHLDFIHTGGMMSDEQYGKKMEGYFRANLRMIQDYPEEPRGWFNASLHFLDAPTPEMRSTGIMFMHQAVVRSPRYAVAIKELCVQGFTDLGSQLENLLSMTPSGHPFYDYATKALTVCNEFGLTNRDMIRCPGHAEKILDEEQFKEFKEQVEHTAEQYAPGGEYSSEKAKDLPSPPDQEGEHDNQ